MKVVKIEIGGIFHTTNTKTSGSASWQYGHSACCAHISENVGTEVIFHCEDGKKFKAILPLQEVREDD